MIDYKDPVRVAAKNAAEAHTNLNFFGAVLAMLEGGLVYGNDSNSAKATARKMVTLCKTEMGKQLTIYDKQVAAAIRAGKKG